jgi:S-DNA-T family DNA segregation ATPase FtsK/SpoIIIE
LSTVPVMGELKAGPFDRFKKKLAKAEVPVTSMPIIPRKNRVDGVQLNRMANWNYPPSSLLEIIDMKPQAGNIQKRMETIQRTLRDFGIDVQMNEVNIGPTVTQYTLKPQEGVKLNQITARQDDLALALAAQSLRVEAPIPGKALVGIEIPNEKKAMVGLRDIIEDKAFRSSGSKLTIALGRDAAGQPVVADIARMPHALVAGATGSGKSVAINSIILTLLINNSPDELRMILVDPKRVELTGYNGLPHLLTPVITEPKDTVAALNWCVKEMERRYKLFNACGKRNIELYNLEPDLGEGKLPFIVLIIDELADLMMVASKEVEGSIVRLAQMARAVGIHLILATQRPSVDVITGLIKANVPTRIAFAVASQIDSRTILDQSGAEKLLGHGDMLYVSTDTPRPRRVQGVYASEKEITSIVAHIKMQEVGDRYDASVLETRVESRLGGSRETGEIDDDLFEEAFEVVRQAGKASSTLLQTRLSVGYARAARLIQIMEDRGLIGPAKGSKPREVYGTSAGSDDAELTGIAPYPDNE